MSLQTTDLTKSVKADNAEVPVELRNAEILKVPGIDIVYDPELHNPVLETLRSHLGMRLFRKHLFHSFSSYMKKEYGHHWPNLLMQARKSRKMKNSVLLKDGDRGADTIRCDVDASWWTWDEGSSLFFWRWPSEEKRDTRNGSSFPWKIYSLPAYKLPQKYPRNARERD